MMRKRQHQRRAPQQEQCAAGILMRRLFADHLNAADKLRRTTVYIIPTDTLDTDELEKALQAWNVPIHKKTRLT